MDTQAAQHPAGQGLLDSGYVVSVVRGTTGITMTMVGDQQFVGVTVPGNPCNVFLCCSESGALALVKKLGEGLDRLWTLRGEEHR